MKTDDADLRRKVVEALGFSGATVVESASDALAVLDLHTVNYERTVRTIDERGKVTGYKLQYVVRYKLISAEGESLRESSVTTRRDFNFDPDQVLQAEIEEESLRQDMLTDLTQQILRHLSTVTASLAPAGEGTLSAPVARG